MDTLYVAGEVLIGREPRLTLVALERLFSRVRPHGSLHAARIVELLVATLPCALIRLLPRMDPHVPL